MVLEELTLSEKPSLVFPFTVLHTYKIQYTIVNVKVPFETLKWFPTLPPCILKR